MLRPHFLALLTACSSGAGPAGHTDTDAVDPLDTISADVDSGPASDAEPVDSVDDNTDDETSAPDTELDVEPSDLADGSDDDSLPYDGDSSPTDASDGEVADAHLPCPDCEGTTACLEGACVDTRSRPCRSHENCGTWTCADAGYCVNPATVTEANLFEASDYPALPWPESWAAEISSDIFAPSFAFFSAGGEAAMSVLASARSPLRSSACIHELVDGDWQRDDTFCEATAAQSSGAVVVVDARNPAQILVGRRLAFAAHALDGTLEQQLLDAILEDDPRRQCTPRPIAVLDFDLDGHLDLYAECDPLAEIGDRALAALSFRRTVDGDFELIPDIEQLSPLGKWGHRLAVATHDVDHDGLLDHFLVNDSYSSPTARNTTLEPGWRLRRCDPTETCEFVVQTALPGSDAWGSFMGAARIHVAGRGELLLLTDHGPIRAIDIGDHETPDISALIGMHDGFHEPSGRYTFSWSSVVEDLNFDGLEDVVVSQGDPNAGAALRDAGVPHSNLFYLQQSDGTFESFEEPQIQAPDGLELSRGAIALDLDYDGLLELFIARWQRAPLIVEETDRGQPRRCSVRPVPSIVPAAGYGISSAPFVDGPWTVERMAGQAFIQPPNEFVGTLRAGFARFPSGAVMPFDCRDGAGPEVLVEPAWISASFVDGALRVAIDPALWPEPIRSVTAALDGPRPASTVELAPADANTWVATIENNPGRVMIRINARWVGVWLTVGDAAP